jgi:hypothetical protein
LLKGGNVSLTSGEDVFVAIHEDGLNDLLQAFFTARPRYLNYGSQAFVSATSVSATRIDAIAFPGIPGGIDWSVHIEIPRVDVHPQSVGLPPELNPLGVQRVSLSTKVDLCVDCGDHERDPERDGRDGKDPDHEHDHGERPAGGKLTPACAYIEVYAIAGVERTTLNGKPAVRLIVDAIELVDVDPNALEQVLECVLLKIIRAAIAPAVLPLDAIAVRTFTLTPTTGPDAQNDQLELAGTLTV